MKIAFNFTLQHGPYTKERMNLSFKELVNRVSAQP